MKQTVVYGPEDSLKKGYLPIFLEILEELRESRWLIWQLFKRDFSIMYKQTFLGIFWPFILPIFSIGTFVILNHSGLFLLGPMNVPYPIYAVLGMVFWQLFSTGLLTTSQSLVLADQMLTKIYFSKKSLVIASFGRIFPPFIIHMTVICILLAFYKIKLSLTILYIPLVLIPLLLLTLGLGFILSLMQSISRDVGNILPMFLTFLMFLTPVLYVAPTDGLLTRIAKMNPVYYFIETARDLVLTGTIHQLGGFIISTVISVGIFIGCLLIFHLAETRIVERI